MKERDLSDPIQLTARELSTLTGVSERLLKEELKPTTPRTDGSVKMTVDDHGIRQISMTGPDKSTAQIRVVKEGDVFKLQGGSIQGAGGLTQLESPADVQHVARAMGNMKHNKVGVHEALASALQEGGVRDNVNDWTYKKGIEHYHAHAHEPIELKGIAGRKMTQRDILERELQGFKREIVRDKAGVVTGSTYTLTTEGRNPEKLVVHTNKNDVVDKVSFHPDTKTRIDLPPTKETQALVLDAAHEARTTRTSISEKIVDRANNQFRHHGIVKQPQTAGDVLGKLAERHEAHVAKVLPAGAAAQAKVAAAEVKGGATSAFKAASTQRGHAKVFVLAAVAAVALTALVGVKLWGGSPEQKKPAPPEAPKADSVNLDRLNNAARAAIGGGPVAATASPTVHHEPKIGPQVIAPVKQRLGGPS